MKFFLIKILKILKLPQYQYIKTLALILINIWLLVIFWKIFAIENTGVIQNSILIDKIEKLVYPLLIYFNFDLNELDINTIKMLILTFIVLISNLLVLHFNHMIILCLLILLTRYLYKFYTDYLILIKLAESAATVNTNTIVQPSIKEQIVDTIKVNVTGDINWLLYSLVAAIFVIGILLIINYTDQTNNNVLIFNKFKIFNQKIEHVDHKIITLNSKIEAGSKQIVNLQQDVSTIALEKQVTAINIKQLNSKIDINAIELTNKITNKTLPISEIDKKIDIVSNNVEDLNTELASVLASNTTLGSMVAEVVSSNTYFTELTTNFLKEFTTEVINSVEKLTPPSSPRSSSDVNNFMKLKSSLDLYAESSTVNTAKLKSSINMYKTDDNL